MEITFFHKNLTKKEESTFVEYVISKADSIEDLLQKFAKDAKLLKVSIEKFDKHDAYEVEFCLVLPVKSIVAREASHSITKAVDFTKDRLLSQIKKHMAILRRDRSHRSIRHSEKIKEEAEVMIDLHSSK
ncbi:hypothetical protein HZC20_03045 [Candidatus Peregrinibacteria bacterium]|nr:hypothetical protein [Candidatus Peregrinibacteria bacterium]